MTFTITAPWRKVKLPAADLADPADAALCRIRDAVEGGGWARNSQIDGCILGLIANVHGDLSVRPLPLELMLHGDGTPVQNEVARRLDRTIPRADLAWIATHAGQVDSETGGYIYGIGDISSRLTSYNNIAKGPKQIIAWIDRAREVPA